MKTRKILFIGIGIVVVLGLALVIGAAFFLDSAIKKGIETVGPRLTKVDVRLDAVTLSLLSGSGKIKGLELGNPAGFKTPTSIKVDTATIELKAGSLLTDKVVINKIHVDGSEITFETDLRANNLSKILANIEESMGGPSQGTNESESVTSRKLQVNEFVMTGGKINITLSALGGQSASVALPEIRLKDLGTGPEGITVADLTRQVMQIVLSRAIQAAGAAASELAAGQAQKAASDTADRIGGQLGGFLKKKKQGPPPPEK